MKLKNENLKLSTYCIDTSVQYKILGGITDPNEEASKHEELHARNGQAATGNTSTGTGSQPAPPTNPTSGV